MASYPITKLKERVNKYILENFMQLITGGILNGILHDITDSINNLLISSAYLTNNKLTLVKNNNQLIEVDLSSFNITVDSSIIEDSQNPVSGNAVYQAIAALNLGLANGLHPPVQNLTALKTLVTINSWEYPDKYMILVESEAAIYRHDRDSILEESSPDVIAPILGAGRWIRMSSGVSLTALQEYLNLKQDKFVGKGYGYLYNWYAVNTGKLAPAGWRVPTRTDYENLITTLGGAVGLTQHLKEAGDDHWDNNTGDNSSGFSAVGSGLRSKSEELGFYNIRVSGGLWTNTEYVEGTSWVFLIYWPDAGFGSDWKEIGACVRCMRDTDPGTATVEDVDGNVYDVIQVAGKWWLKQNLKTTHYNDGELIPNVTDQQAWGALTTGAYCAYDNDLQYALSITKQLSDENFTLELKQKLEQLSENPGSGSGIIFWSTLADGATIKAGQSVNYNNILYFCKETHAVGTPKTFDSTKFDKEGEAPATIAYNTSIPFSVPDAVMEDASIIADTTFTPNPVNAKKGAKVQLRIVYNSAGKVILFTGFKQTADSCPIYAVVGAAQVIDFRYDGTDYWVKVSNENTNLALKSETLVKGAGGTAYVPTLDNDPAPKKWTEDKILEKIANYYPGIPTGSGVELGYYGIQWNENYPNSGCKRTGTLAGYAGGGYYNEAAYPLSTRPNSNVPEQYLFVHNKIKRCLLRDDGTVNYYLDPTSSYNRENTATTVTGTTTGAVANKIVCAGLFSGVAADYVGRFVHNTTSGKTSKYALVTAKDSNDQLTIDCGVNNVASPTFFDLGDTFELCTAILDGTDGQVMVEIPKFFIRQSYSGGVHTLDISLYPYDGFSLHPAFQEGVTTKEKIYFGVFEAFDATNKLASVPLKVPTASITRASFRTKAANRGAFIQESFWYRSALQILFYVEYADLNSQVRLPGYTERKVYADAARRKTGRTLAGGNYNHLVYADQVYDADIEADANWNEHKVVANSYRGIENLYGNLWKFLDGINLYERNIYVSNLRVVFADDTATGYDNLGIALPTDGYIKTIHSVTGGILPKSNGGSSSTYFADYVYSAPGWRVGISGGSLNNGASAGVGYLIASSASSGANTYVGARLCF